MKTTKTKKQIIDILKNIAFDGKLSVKEKGEFYFINTDLVGNVKFKNFADKNKILYEYIGGNNYKIIFNPRKEIIDFLNKVDFLNKNNRYYKINDTENFLTLQVKIILAKEVEQVYNFIKTLENKISFSILAIEKNNLLIRFNI